LVPSEVLSADAEAAVAPRAAQTKTTEMMRLLIRTPFGSGTPGPGANPSQARQADTQLPDPLLRSKSGRCLGVTFERNGESLGSGGHSPECFS
jgi:hypothetical protein